MIKNTKEFTPKEWIQFRDVFLKYFNESSLIGTGKKSNFLESFMTMAQNKKCVKTILQMLKEGSKQGFVSLDDAEESISGFLVGSIENGTGAISHFFVDVKCPMGRRIQSLELFKAFSKELAIQGVDQVVAKSDLSDVELNDTLSSLGFEVLKKDDVSNEYGRNIA